MSCHEVKGHEHRKSRSRERITIMMAEWYATWQGLRWRHIYPKIYSGSAVDASTTSIPNRARSSNLKAVQCCLDSKWLISTAHITPESIYHVFLPSWAGSVSLKLRVFRGSSRCQARGDFERPHVTLAPNHRFQPNEGFLIGKAHKLRLSIIATNFVECSPNLQAHKSIASSPRTTSAAAFGPDPPTIRHLPSTCHAMPCHCHCHRLKPQEQQIQPGAHSSSNLLK